MKTTTRKNFAVAGYPISHSLSPALFYNVVGKNFGVYSRLLDKDVSKIIDMVNAFDLKGINVTSPLKRDILSYFRADNNKEEEVVNTVVFDEEKIIFKNTDIDGVYNSLAFVDNRADKSALILGGGGASIASILASKKLKFGKISISNRTMSKSKKLAEKYGINDVDFSKVDASEYDIIINTIPIFISKFEEFRFKQNAVIFDANYNNKPLKNIAKNNNLKYIDGTKWLLEQGKVGYELFTGNQYNDVEIEEIKGKFDTQKPGCISLIGPMGAYKSTVGKALAKKLDYRHLDIDKEIERIEGRKISDIFKRNGESYFRELEHKVLTEIKREQNTIISTGGGIIVNAENINWLKENCWNILLYVSPKASLKRMNTAKRPLLRDSNALETLKTLFENRKDKYFKTADVVINTDYRDSQTIIDMLYEDYSKTFGV